MMDNSTSDIRKLNESLKKAILQTEITAEYIKKKLEEKLEMGGAI